MENYIVVIQKDIDVTSEACETEDQEEIYRFSAVMAALEDVGLAPGPRAVVRANDKYVQVSSRKSKTSHRVWTRAEIDKLVVAFRLRHQAGMDWARVATLIHSGQPLQDLLRDELDALTARVHDLDSKRKALARLHEELEAA